MNKKEKRLALKSALTYKVLDKELIVVQSIKFDTNKTKEMVNLLEGLNLTNKKVLVCVEELTEWPSKYTTLLLNINTLFINTLYTCSNVQNCCRSRISIPFCNFILE